MGWGVLACLTAAACSDDASSTAWKRNGEKVDRDVVESLQGSEHCGQEGVTVLRLTWPLGEARGEVRTYVRDADGVLKDETSSTFEADAELPEEAEYST